MLHNIHNNIRRLAGRIGLRLVRARRGSVLILVVVLLVLMAILGTAFLVTARTDRAGSKLYEHNVQIDLLVQGLINMAEAALTDTSYQTVPTAPGVVQYYDDWFTDSTANGPGVPMIDHTWLSARFPVPVNNPGYGSALGVLATTSTVPLYPIPKGAVVQVGTSNGAAGTVYVSLIDNNMTSVLTAGNWASFNPSLLGSNGTAVVTSASPIFIPVWPAVSAPLAYNGNFQAHFEDPRSSPTLAINPSGYVNNVWSNVRTFVSPSYLTINGNNLPALTYYSPFDGKVETALAASATGNGIADSFLWRLPVGSIDGITYYAAVRIVDNNSAINVNTANSSTFEWAYNGGADFPTLPGATVGSQGFGPGMLPSEIGLDELTYSYNNGSLNTATSDSAGPFAELMEVNRYRWTSPGAPGTAVTHPAGIQGGGSSPIDDLNNPHADFAYRNVGDAMWNGLGRRISNPGAVQAGAGTTPIPYTPFSWGESAELAYRGDLVNPNATPSVIEQVLTNSVYNHSVTARGVGIIPSVGSSFRTQPWDPFNTTNWFSGYQLNVLNASNPYTNARPYFVARNPTSNCMPAHALTTTVTGLTQNDLANLQTYMTGLPATPNAPNYFTTTLVPRVSLNTADVTMLDSTSLGRPAKTPTLWLGFYNAMLDALVTNPNILGNVQGYAQFRSPIRDVGTGAGTANGTFLNGPQTMLLRSLLAACNAKDLRDSDDDVTVEPPSGAGLVGIPVSATISGVPTTVNVVAFGFEKQPFITEVYANNETVSPTKVGFNQGPNPNAASIGAGNPKGYVLVELYNPYDVPIDMTNWTIGVLRGRVSGTYPNPPMTIVPLTAFAGFGRDAQSPIIPAKCYMILENCTLGNSHAATASTYDAQYRPWQAYTPAIVPSTVASTTPGSVLYYYVPNLHQAMQDTTDATQPGGELVLLRQPKANGSAFPTVLPANLSTSGIGFVPVDSFDFSGMQIVAGPPGNTKFTAMHYLRASPGGITAANSGPASNVAGEQRGTFWKFVYPGRWSPTAYAVPINAFGNFASSFAARQEGIAVSSWDTQGVVTTVKGDSWADKYPLGSSGALTTSPFTNTIAYKAPISFGKDTSTLVGTTTAPPAVPSYVGVPFYSSYVNTFPAIQLNGTDMGGPTKQYATPGPPFMFPFGGFARAGDVLQVPYIGSYTILNSNGGIIEMNPITRDCAMADDGDNLGSVWGLDDNYEQVGRFCPILAGAQPSEAATLPYIPATDPYVWAGHIFDYFTTIQNPNDDYFPNTDPNTYVQGAWNPLTSPAPSPLQYAGTGNLALPVLNSAAGAANTGSEDLASIDGLININTASQVTLTAVPWMQIGGTSVSVPTVCAQSTYQQADAAIAGNIITYRNTYGPFKTLFDLNRVLNYTSTATNPAFQNINANTINGAAPPTSINPATSDYNIAMGDISPLASGSSPTDGVTNDFETRFNMITRVSNLLTTRSDTYTVYVLVQGWSGVGTATPQVVVQRRAAFIVDRSKLTPSSSSLGVTQVQAY